MNCLSLSPQLTSDDHFARDEYEQNDLGIGETIDDAGKDLGLVAAHLRVTHVKGLEVQTEAHIDAAHYILYLKVRESGLFVCV